MIDYKRLLLLGILFIVAGTLVSTAAAQSGDQAVEGVYLSPADSTNGEAYASMDGNGQLWIDVSGLNDGAVTTIDSVFTISSTRDDETIVWVEPPSDQVTFYRMDTGGTISTQSSAVAIDGGETITVGMRVDTRHSSVQDGTITIRARLPEDGSAPSQGSSGDAPVRGPTTPEPDSDGSDTTPTPEPPNGDEPTPSQPGTATPAEPTTPTPESTPEPEVGGFPWLPLLGLLFGLALIPLGFFVYRRLKWSGIRFEAAADGLDVSPGTLDEELYERNEDSVTFDFRETERWADRDPESTLAFDGVATLANTGDSALDVFGVFDGETGGIGILADDGGTDLLATSVSLDPGQSTTLSVVLPGDVESRRLMVRCVAEDESA